MQSALRLLKNPVDILTGYLVLSVLFLNILDAYISAHLIKLGETELNEFYVQLMKTGTESFLGGKIFLASLLLFIVLVANKGRVSHVALWFFYVLYSANTLYQIAILSVVELGRARLL